MTEPTSDKGVALAFFNGDGETRAGVFCFDGENNRRAGDDNNEALNGDFDSLAADGGKIEASKGPRLGD